MYSLLDLGACGDGITYNKISTRESTEEAMLKLLQEHLFVCRPGVNMYWQIADGTTVWENNLKSQNKMACMWQHARG